MMTHCDLASVRPSNLAAAHVRHTPEAVYALRIAYASGVSIYDLAKRTGLPRWTMSKLVRGVSYRHVPMPGGE